MSIDLSRQAMITTCEDRAISMMHGIIIMILPLWRTFVRTGVLLTKFGAYVDGNCRKEGKVVSLGTKQLSPSPSAATRKSRCVVLLWRTGCVVVIGF